MGRYIAEGGYKETLWKWKNEAKQEKIFFVWDNPLLPRVREWRQGDQSRFLRDFCKGRGIPEVRFHDLRATFITNMLTKSVALSVVMFIAGHRKIARADAYNHLEGLGVRRTHKPSTQSYGLLFQTLPNDSLIPFVKRRR